MTKDYQFLKEAINQNIVNSNLDIGAVYFILKDIYFEIERNYYMRINQELLEEQKQNTETKNEEATSE